MVNQKTTTSSHNKMIGKRPSRQQQALSSLVPCLRDWPDRDGQLHLYAIDLMTDRQISETYDMILAASKCGQGFGVGEYDDEEDFRQDVAGGFRFAIMERESSSMVAAFILNESRYTRGCRVADPYIIVRDDQRGRGLGKLCMDMALEFAPVLGFIGMYADTFANNTAMIRIIESIDGFQKVGALPMGGVMASGEVVGSVVFYKDFRPATPDLNNNSIRKTGAQTG